MDFDTDQYLTDVLEAVLSMPGDPIRQIDAAVEDVIAAHVDVLRKLAQRHREAILGMAEERRRTGRPVPCRWKV